MARGRIRYLHVSSVMAQSPSQQSLTGLAYLRLIPPPLLLTYRQIQALDAYLAAHPIAYGLGMFFTLN